MKVATIICVPVALIVLSDMSAAQDSTMLNEESHFRIREEIIREVRSQVQRELGSDLFAWDDYVEPPAAPRDRVERHSLEAFPSTYGIPRNYSARQIVETPDDRLLLRYNRVEGVFVGLQAPRRFHWDKARQFTAFGSLGYGFGAHRWQYSIGAAQQFGFGTELLEFGVESHNTIESRDYWIVGNAENSLNALLARYDYRDYFAREGFSGWLGLYHRAELLDAQVKVVFLSDIHSSRDAVVHWSVFRSAAAFRANPPVAEGRMKSVMISADLHQLEEKDHYPRGWSISLSSEFAGRGLKGDFSFDSYVLDVRRYQPLGQYESLNARLRAVTSHGTLPPQRLHHIGGISTVSAYAFKAFSGNRLMLANVEYLVSGEILSEGAEFPLSLLSKVGVVLFVDAGYVDDVPTDVSATRGFGQFSFRDVKSDWGIALGSRDGQYRLGFSWRLDERAPVAIFFRMRRPF